MSLRLPVVVSGRDADGGTWSEPTETDDISTTGALLQLNQPVALNDRLYIRSHRPDGAPVEVAAVVVRAMPNAHGATRVGVAISESLDNWLRFFVSWVADDQPSAFDDNDDEPSNSHFNSDDKSSNILNVLLGVI